MGAVYLLTLRQLAGKWRLIIMAALAAMPVVFTILVVGSSSTPNVNEFETVVFSGMLAGSIIPLVVVAIAAAAFANEVEDKTLANLALAPIPRWQIVLPKLLASISLAGPFAVVSAGLTTHAAFLGDTRATLAVTTGALVAVIVYASAFTWLGLVSTHAIGIGLLYIVLWEGFFSGFVTGVRALSIRHYAITLMNAMDPRRFATADLPGSTATVITCVVVTAGFTLLAIRRLRRMDIP